uniref:rRNA N-glycosylase n=1 Tax=Leersia perrieri TaxID=77586 RepID=A0A0D9UX29_9ORYZ
MALNPLFTVTFNVSGPSANRWPTRATSPTTARSSRRWFHVVLRSTTRTLTLAVRADNLCLEGFRGSNNT